MTEIMYDKILGKVREQDEGGIDPSLLNGKADKVQNAVDGHFAALDSHGNLKDSGYGANDFALKTAIETSIPTGGMKPNIIYNLGTLQADTTLSMAAATDNEHQNLWYFCFDIGETLITITWPAGIVKWQNNDVPIINTNCHYEISVLFGTATCIQCSTNNS